MADIAIQEQITSTKVRTSNMELLRIVATLFTIILHYNNIGSGGGFLYTAELGYHYHVLLGFEMMSICAVNVFVMISGYFMCTSRKVSILKPVLLYVEVILFALLRYGMNLATGMMIFSKGDLLRCLLPLNWYVTVYIALYLITPYINRIIRGISLLQFRTLLIIGLLVFSFWPSILDIAQTITEANLSALSPLGIQGSGNGYTIVNFILMYFIGAYLRVSAQKEQTIFPWLTVYFICVVFLILYSRISFSGALSYCNPVVILQAVALFKIFQSLRVKSRFINAVASCSFGVYLLHTIFFPYIQIERFVTGQLFLIPVHIIVSAILIYAICGMIYWIYSKTLRNVLTKGFQRLSLIAYEVD